MPDHPDRGKDRSLQAVALGYRPDKASAPVVLAKGRAEVARNILRLAEEHGIPIESDPDLLQCLAPLSVDMEIPVEAYVAVARILAFLYRVNGGPAESANPQT